MKKILLLLVITLVFGSGCSINFNDDKETKINELEQKIEQLESNQQQKTDDAQLTETSTTTEEVLTVNNETVKEKIVYKDIPTYPSKNTPTETVPEKKTEAPTSIETKVNTEDTKKIEEKKYFDAFTASLNSYTSEMTSGMSLFNSGNSSYSNKSYFTAINYYNNAVSSFDKAYGINSNITISSTYVFYATMSELKALNADFSMKAKQVSQQSKRVSEIMSTDWSNKGTIEMEAAFDEAEELVISIQAMIKEVNVVATNRINKKNELNTKAAEYFKN